MSELRLNPFEQIFDANGDPLDDGFVYVGVAGLDSKTNQVEIFWDAALTIPAAQPLSTQGGYISRSGSPAVIYGSEELWSVQVFDKNLVQVYFELVVKSLTPDYTLPTGASLIGYGSQSVKDALDQAATLPILISDSITEHNDDAAAHPTLIVAANLAADRAEAAAGSVISGTTYLTLDALVAAALPNGQRATVWTVDDDHDNYISNTGLPEWKAKNQQVTASDRFALGLYPFPVDPKVLVNTLNGDGYGGRGVSGMAAMSTNIYPFVSGQMPAASGFAGTITPRYGAGATTGLSQRLQFTTTAQVFYFAINRFLQAGVWVTQIKVKSSPGAGTQNVRFGELADVTNVSVSEAGWTTITRVINSVGATKSVMIKGDTTNMPDILVDEVRIHRNDASVDLPVVFGGGSLMRDVGLVGTYPLVGGILKGITAGGILKAPTYPAPSTWASWTFMVAIRRNAAPSTQEIIMQTPTDTLLGTTSNTLRFSIPSGSTGEISTSPVTSVLNGISPDYCNNGWQILAIRAKAGRVDNWINGVQTRSGTTANPGFSWTYLRCFGNTETSLPFLGDCAGIWGWDSYLTDSQLLGAFDTAQRRIEARGEQTGRGQLAILCEGDSRSAVFTGAQSPTFAWLMYDAATTDGIQRYGGNFATSGDGLTDVEGDVAELVVSIKISAAMGRVPVVTLLIGVNDNSLIIANPAAYMTRLEAVLNAYKAAGARTVICTELPLGAAAGGGTGSAWETARATLRSLMFASTVPDAVADLGNTATTMGNPNSPDINPTLWDDTIHPKAAGHALLAPVLWAAIKVAAAK